MIEIEFFNAQGIRKSGINEFYHFIIDGWPGERTSVCAGVLSNRPEDLELGDYVYIHFQGKLLFTGLIRSFEPRMGPVKKLIRNKYFSFRNLFIFEAEFNPGIVYSERLTAYFEDTSLSDILRLFINKVNAPLFYTVNYSGAYGEGQAREYLKFLDRRADLSVYIDHYNGDLINPARINTSSAVALDGRTISGIEVDGIGIGDVVLIGIEPESLTLAGALTMHPELEGLTQTQYEDTEYYANAVEARDWLQDEIDTYGIEYIEINWHRNDSGLTDSRADRYDRLQTLVYADGRCLNVGLIEKQLSSFAGPAEDFSYPAEILMKEWASYWEVTAASLDECERTVEALSFYKAGSLEIIDLLARLAGNYIWRFAPFSEPGRVTGYNSPLTCCLEWRCASGRLPDRHIRYNPDNMSFDLKGGVRGLFNRFIFYGGNLGDVHFQRKFENLQSIARYGPREETIVVPGVITHGAAEWLETALLSDFAGIRDEGFIILRSGGIEIMSGDGLRLAGYDTGVEAYESPEYGMFRLDESALDCEAGLDGGIHRAGRVRKYIAPGSVRTEVYFQGGYSSLNDPLRYLRGNPDGVTEEELNYLDSMTGSLELDLSALDSGSHLD